MVRKALILQSWYGKTGSNWYPWLKKEMEKKGYTVYLPDLPTMHSNLPDMAKQLKFIKDNIPVDENTIAISHSIGSLLALRLAEKMKYKKMFLVAGWDFDDLTLEHKLFWPNKLNHGKIKENVKEIFCFSSDNDPFVFAWQAEAMSKRLGGKYILIKGAGHFNEKAGYKKLPQILNYL